MKTICVSTEKTSATDDLGPKTEKKEKTFGIANERPRSLTANTHTRNLKSKIKRNKSNYILP